jgi:hypothetical protein
MLDVGIVMLRFVMLIGDADPFGQVQRAFPEFQLLSAFLWAIGSHQNGVQQQLVANKAHIGKPIGAGEKGQREDGRSNQQTLSTGRGRGVEMEQAEQSECQVEGLRVEGRVKNASRAPENGFFYSFIFFLETNQQ